MTTKPWGLTIDGFPPDFGVVTAFATSVQSTPSYVLWFKNWTGNFITYTASDFQSVLSSGALPILTWQPGDANGANITHADILAGTYDSYIDSYASGLKALGVGTTIYIRLAHEMNGNWYCWCVGVGGNTASSYIAMWQYVWQRFKNAGATNVKWLWCPNAHWSGETATYAQCYPGDNYVDMVALDYYNVGNDSSGHTWRTFNPQCGQSITDIVAVAPTKPLIIAELGCVMQPGYDDVSWILDALTVQIQHDSRISAFLWFNALFPSHDVRLSLSSARLSAFRAALNSTATYNKIK